MSVPQLLTEQELADMFNVSIHKVRNDRRRGGGVPFVRIGGAVRYHPDTIEAFLEANVHTTTKR